MLTICIQAGGISSRMGQNKALMPFLGKPLIARIVERLRPAADELWIIANDSEPFQFLGLPVSADLLPGMGKLGGLYTALSVAGEPLVALAACDMPFVSAALIQAACIMMEEEDLDVVIPRSAEGLEPQHAVYRRETCLPAVYQALSEGKQRMISWFDAVKVRELSLDEIRVYDPDGTAFINVNTPDEFRRAEELAKTLESG
ncbi:MAG: molybdenum cofactor guanylyltransferase [Anaerolineaceae bacterium]